MKVSRTIEGARGYLKKARRKGASVGFVPTMGCLHEGHLSLVKAARRDNDIVALSIFVNPTQFGPNEDFKKYPRDFERDARLARAAGADLLFYPPVRRIYPKGFKSYVEVVGITEGLCGASRPGHFRGVATVVTKLFNIIQPDVAYFGQKDAQQALVIKEMARDLDMDLKVKVMPTVREADGLAMSSRNAYLSKTERADAPVLYEALKLAKRMVKDGVRDAARIKRAMRHLINSKRGVRIDYISIVDTRKLREKRRAGKDTLVALAVRIGKTRLIDNIVLGGKI